MFAPRPDAPVGLALLFIAQVSSPPLGRPFPLGGGNRPKLYLFHVLARPPAPRGGGGGGGGVFSGGERCVIECGAGRGCL